MSQTRTMLALRRKAVKSYFMSLGHMEEMLLTRVWPVPSRSCLGAGPGAELLLVRLRSIPPPFRKQRTATLLHEWAPLPQRLLLDLASCIAPRMPCACQLPLPPQGLSMDYEAHSAPILAALSKFCKEMHDSNRISCAPRMVRTSVRIWMGRWVAKCFLLPRSDC